MSKNTDPWPETAVAGVVLLDPDDHRPRGRPVLSAMIETNTILREGVGRIRGISVIVAKSGTGFLSDAAVTGKISGNEIVAIPPTVGFTPLDLPVSEGIAVAPAPGMVLRVLFE